MSLMVKKKPGRKRLSKTDLYKIAQKHDIPNRSKMSREKLLEVTRVHRQFNRRSMKSHRKRIIVVKDGILYELTITPRKQTPRGKAMDQAIRARTHLRHEKDREGFGWLGDTTSDYNLWDVSHVSEKEVALVGATVSKAGLKRLRKKRGTKVSAHAKRLAKKESIDVFSAQHMMNDLEDMGLDPRMIDEIADEIDFSSYDSGAEAYAAYSKQKTHEVFYH